MEKKELNEILESHERWILGEDGEHANLWRANFMNAKGLPVLLIQVNTSFENRTITYIPSLDVVTADVVTADVVTAGRFQGTLEEFEERMEKEHKDNPFALSLYRCVIAFLKQEAEEDRERRHRIIREVRGK